MRTLAQPYRHAGAAGCAGTAALQEQRRRLAECHLARKGRPHSRRIKLAGKADARKDHVHRKVASAVTKRRFMLAPSAGAVPARPDPDSG
jgi:hypothetical protein